MRDTYVDVSWAKRSPEICEREFDVISIQKNFQIPKKTQIVP